MIVAVVNSKGGVGKSTVAVHAAKPAADEMDALLQEVFRHGTHKKTDRP